MSCFMVSLPTLHALGVWRGRDAAEHGATIKKRVWLANQAAGELWAANVAAVRERYPAHADEMVGPTEYQPMTIAQYNAACQLDPRAVLTLHAHYEYQACDWSKYSGSHAERFAREALDAACRQLRNGPWGLPEYGS